MNKIEILRCSNEEIAEFKKEYKLKEIKFDDGYEKILLNNVPVALIDLTEQENKNGYIRIDAFETFKKREGVGTIIIKYIQDRCPDIKFCLYSESNAEKFWEKMGFISGDDGLGVKMYFYPY